jgi:glycosyltransferase involved in cell wall biosynthesis
MKILFAFGDTGSGYSGGDLLVYRLANHLAERNQVEFIRLIDWRRIIGRYLPGDLPAISDETTPLRRRIYDAVARRRFLRLLATGLAVTPSQRRVWPLNPRIRVAYYDGKRPIASEFDHAVATNWMTAYFVDRAVKAKKKHNLIQNFEDSPVYSGTLARLVTPSYSLDLRKIVISEALRLRFETDCPILVYPGVDIAQFLSTRSFEHRPPHSLILPLKAGPYKGTRQGFEAVKRSRLKHPDTTLLTFGNKHAAPMAGLRSTAWCRVLHNPSTPSLVAAYNSARFLVFPSRMEGFPVVPLEAMACGSVVVSTPNTGTSAYLIDGENGIIAKGFDPESLHDAIERAFGEGEILPRIRARALVTTREYSWERTHAMFGAALDS